MANKTELENLETTNLEIDKVNNCILKELTSQIEDLYKFRNLFFESHPIELASEKNKLIEEKMNALEEKFQDIDENDIPIDIRAQYLYLKGRLFNVGTKYDERAIQYLSKAVKLDPHLVRAWNELGECYWKNENVKEAKNSFEAALKQERNIVALRCLSIILRQEATHSTQADRETIERSVELAKEAVAQDIKDGMSWSVLGNAHLCRFFLLSQEPVTLKAAMSAYKQAALDPVARGQSDLFYNYGVALKYDEQFVAALQNFRRACHLDPTWDVPSVELKKLEDYLAKVAELVRSKGKIKTKKIQQIVQTINEKYLGHYADVPSLLRMRTSDLKDGQNDSAVILGKVVGSVFSENVVPFTFAIVDESMECCAITVYNWAGGHGVIIGDTVAIPRPLMRTHTLPESDFKFKSIRVNNPMQLLINGKKVGRNQFAGTRVTTTYEIH